MAWSKRPFFGLVVLAILQGKPAEEATDHESEEMASTSATTEESTQEDGED